MIKGSAKACKIARFVVVCAMSVSLACGLAPTALAKAAGAAIGNDNYETLDEALAVAAKDHETTKITLLGDANGRYCIEEGMDVEIDLNGYEIANDTVPLAVFGGSLALTGEGAVKETAPHYASVAVEGNGAQVDIGEGVELEGWSGLMVDKHADEDVHVQIAGSVNAVPDENGESGHGVYVNCDSRNTGKGAPQIALTETSKIVSSGNGIYAAGYADWTLSGSVQAGADALSIKSGAFTIEGGRYHSMGAYHKVPVTNNSGAESTGAALSVTSNKNYAGKIDVQVNGGTFESERGNAIYEGIAANKDGKAAAAQSEAKICIKDGVFKAGKGKDLFAVTAADDKVVKIAEMLVPNAKKALGAEKTVKAKKAEKLKKAEKPAKAKKKTAPSQEKTNTAVDDAGNAAQADESDGTTADGPAEEVADEL